MRWVVGLLGVVAAVGAAYVEASGAEIGAAGERSSFTPSVAFKPGYKNQYLDPATGQWVSDSRQYATAMKAKVDILKYCQSAYPKMDITNFVEDSHFHKISSWCKAEKQKLCKWTHTVRPFKCIAGRFESEALLVPNGCRFTHEDGSDKCNDFAHWEKVATDKCSASPNMAVRSFALLAPCGLDMYSGVEMVCCPNADAAAKATTMSTRFGDEEKEDSQQDDPYYDDDDSDDDDEDDEESSEEDEEDASTTGEQDPYFRVADPDNEHENFKAAERRLEARHREELATKTHEWEELSTRYRRMRTEDPKRAESFKAENTLAFQKTIQALQEEFAEARRQLDEVHQERVMAALNERKRSAIKEYRDALASSLDAPAPHKVLKSLEAYIRSEEKDRRHSLNRFKHLLKAADPRTAGFESALLRRLKDIDLRINGTIAMLHDMPRLETKVKPVVMEFWRTFRRENSADVGDASLSALGGKDLYPRLVARYRQLYATPAKEEAEPRTQLRIVDPVEEVRAQVQTRFDDIVSHQMEPEPFVAHAKQSAHFHSSSALLEEEDGGRSGGVGLVLGVGASLLAVAALVGVLLLRRAAPKYEGVPTAEAAAASAPNSEEQLNGFQASGYENPTYRFFDEKA